MTIDIDVAQIAEDLNNKADIDLGNTINHLGTTAKEFFSGVGMPSTKYVNLSLGASSDEYTAPANGYVCVDWSDVTSAGGTSSLDVQDPAIRTFSSDIPWQRHCLPVQKGQKFKVYYGNASGRTLSLFRFYYAEGVK